MATDGSRPQSPGRGVDVGTAAAELKLLSQTARLSTASSSGPGPRRESRQPQRGGADGGDAGGGAGRGRDAASWSFRRPSVRLLRPSGLSSGQLPRMPSELEAQHFLKPLYWRLTGIIKMQIIIGNYRHAATLYRQTTGINIDRM